jgi:hypothetical protein
MRETVGYEGSRPLGSSIYTVQWWQKHIFMVRDDTAAVRTMFLITWNSKTGLTQNYCLDKKWVTVFKHPVALLQVRQQYKLFLLSFTFTFTFERTCFGLMLCRKWKKEGTTCCIVDGLCSTLTVLIIITQEILLTDESHA